MSKSRFIQIIVAAFAATCLSYFITAANPICNYSNSMSQQEMAANPGYQHGYPFHYLSDDRWHCSERGETGRGLSQEAKLTPVVNFAGDWFVWFSVIFTLYVLSTGQGLVKKR